MDVGFADNMVSVVDDKFDEPFFGGENFGIFFWKRLEYIKKTCYN